MKKIVLLILSVTLVLGLCLSSCASKELSKYYSEKDNYIEVTGIISDISYNEDSSAIYLSFSELDPKLDDVCFKIAGKNLQIVQNNGIDEKIKVGDTLDFVTAPKYFGDGYVMPIAAVSLGDEEILEFEEGFNNLQELY